MDRGGGGGRGGAGVSTADRGGAAVEVEAPAPWIAAAARAAAAGGGGFSGGGGGGSRGGRLRWWAPAAAAARGGGRRMPIGPHGARCLGARGGHSDVSRFTIGPPDGRGGPGGDDDAPVHHTTRVPDGWEYSCRPGGGCWRSGGSPSAATAEPRCASGPPDAAVEVSAHGVQE